jgi:enoyl-CoA hydratase
MAEGIAAIPQETMLSDRHAVLEGAGLPLVQGLALEAQLGRTRHGVALEGAERFAGGEGRHGAGTGI